MNLTQWRWRAWWNLAIALIVGLWVLWPTVHAGLNSDDFVFEAMLDDDFASPRAGLDLFTFADGSAEDAAALRENGYPWWTPDDYRIAMLRPLASALIHLDRRLFGSTIWLRHLHSMAWWVLLIVGAWQLYRRLLPGPLGAGALLLFAVDQSHHLAVSWLANRGGLISVGLGVWGLLAYLRFRDGEGRRFGALAALCFSTALLFGEWVFPLFAYVLMHELLARRDGWLRRGLSMGLAGVPALVFLVVRGALGYGARGSDVYKDPMADPLGFLPLLAERIPIFLADIVLDVPATWWIGGTPWRAEILSLGLISPALWSQLPDWHSWQLALGVAAALLATVALRAAWPGCAQGERRQLRWLVAGALLALVPVAGSFPSRRLTLVAMLGLAPAIAVVFRALLRGLRHSAGESPLRFALLWVALLTFSELQLFSALRHDLTNHALFQRGSLQWVQRAELDPAQVARQRVVIISGAHFATTYYFPFMWRHGGRARPRSVYVLSSALHAHRIRRVAHNAFEMEILGGTWLDSEWHFRPAARPIHTGEVIRLQGMEVHVVRSVQGRPRTVRFEFATALEHPELVFLTPSKGGLLRVEMPELGQETVVRRPSIPDWLRLERAAYKRRSGSVPSFIEHDPVPDFVEFEPG